MLNKGYVRYLNSKAKAKVTLSIDGMLVICEFLDNLQGLALKREIKFNIKLASKINI